MRCDTGFLRWERCPERLEFALPVFILQPKMRTYQLRVSSHIGARVWAPTPVVSGLSCLLGIQVTGNRLNYTL